MIPVWKISAQIGIVGFPNDAEGLSYTVYDAIQRFRRFFDFNLTNPLKQLNMRSIVLHPSIGHLASGNLVSGYLD